MAPGTRANPVRLKELIGLSEPVWHLPQCCADREIVMKENEELRVASQYLGPSWLRLSISRFMNILGCKTVSIDQENS